MEDRSFVRWSKVLDHIELIVITVVLGYGVDQVKSLTANVEKLNTSMAVILVRSDSLAQELSDAKARIQFLERNAREGK